MKGPQLPASDFVSQYCEELLRWNRQISLISRNNPEKRIKSLVTQSVDGIVALWRVLFGREGAQIPAGTRTYYCDVGSGAGIPGLIWHEVMTKNSEFNHFHTSLFEPRSKRAWFLKRMVASLGLENISVEAQRWGGGPLGSGSGEAAASDFWLISMKALRLTDEDILSGCRRLSGEKEGVSTKNIWIGRYQPPENSSDAQTDTRNDLSTPRETPNTPAVKKLICGSPTQPSATLEVSMYRVSP